jgi:hypothetical protein
MITDSMFPTNGGLLRLVKRNNMVCSIDIVPSLFLLENPNISFHLPL